MHTVIVRYRLRSGKETENRQLVESVFAELEFKSPPGVAYASFQSLDQLTFFHIAFTVDEEKNPIPTLPAFKEFQRAIGNRCEEKPVVTTVNEVGSYNFRSSLAC